MTDHYFPIGSKNKFQQPVKAIQKCPMDHDEDRITILSFSISSPGMIYWRNIGNWVKEFRIKAYGSEGVVYGSLSG